MPLNPRLLFDRKALGDRDWLVGIDEVGRGAIAGPLMTCAVCVSRSFYGLQPMPRGSGKINDSKLVKPAARTALDALIRSWASYGHLFFAFGSASHEEVDRFNVFGATVLAMHRALDALSQDGDGRFYLARTDASRWPQDRHPTLPSQILLDGIPMRHLPYLHQAVPGGDAKSLAIAMASILAKVRRDTLMVEMHNQFPHYCFDSNKGYRSPDQKRGLLQYGPSPIHRLRLLRNVNLSNVE